MYNEKQVAVEVQDLWENFRIYHHRNMTLKDTLVRLRRSVYEEFWALKGVSFKISKGETLGIIGENGSGKSTLLKCIAGILKPARGEVTINGRISPLLELGAGFHPELSGRENIYINGAILGLTKKQIDKVYDDIVEFSGLENFIDTQVKFYSSGMYIRLGFSVATQVNPDILLVDEVLAVGDIQFQNKCFEIISQLRKQGKTVVFVGHDLGIVRRLCDKVALLSKGEIVAVGKPDFAIDKYVYSGVVSIEEQYDRPSESTTGKVVKRVRFLNKGGKDCDIFVSGELLQVIVELFDVKCKDLILGIGIHDEQGHFLFGTNNKLDNHDLRSSLTRCEVGIQFKELPLNAGRFFVSVEVADGVAPNGSYNLIERFDKHFAFTVVGGYSAQGSIYFNYEWQ